MKTQIVTEVVSIANAGQINHFEIRIPDKVKSIIGVETSIRFLNNVFLADDVTGSSGTPKIFEIADVRLHGAKDANLFYNHTIKECVWMVNPMDFYFQNAQMLCPYIFHAKHEADEIQVQPKSTRIKGFVKDIIAEEFPIQYQVTICVHFNAA